MLRRTEQFLFFCRQVPREHAENRRCGRTGLRQNYALKRRRRISYVESSYKIITSFDADALAATVTDLDGVFSS